MTAVTDTSEQAALVQRLRAAGCVFAEDEADLLMAAPGDLDALAARRVSGEPLEQVLGWAAFCGLRIAVAAGVFVPVTDAPTRPALLYVRTSLLAAP